MACYLTATPNMWGCHDPQCGDSTWDHECPVGPCDTPEHQHAAALSGPWRRTLVVTGLRAGTAARDDEIACAVANALNVEWHSSQVYVEVYDADGKMLAHSQRPA